MLFKCSSYNSSLIWLLVELTQMLAIWHFVLPQLQMFCLFCNPLTVWASLTQIWTLLNVHLGWKKHVHYGYVLACWIFIQLQIHCSKTKRPCLGYKSMVVLYHFTQDDLSQKILGLIFFISIYYSVGLYNCPPHRNILWAWWPLKL